jgi:DNA-binding CsgD family transcriptional regulator
VDYAVVSRYFPGLPTDQFNEIQRQFAVLDSAKDAFYALIHAESGKQKMPFINPGAVIHTGHALEKFSYDDGFAFIYSITPTAYRSLVLEQELYHLKKARHPGYDPSKPFLVEMDGALTHADGTIMTVRLIGVFLEFSVDRIPKLAVGVYQIVDRMSDSELMMSRTEIESALRRIDKIRKAIVPCDLTNPNLNHEVIRLSYALYDCEEITRQEYRVLKLLADGHSTGKISDQLCISPNTTETHRRHLLQKFKAANVAEMIKKATKMYWLE